MTSTFLSVNDKRVTSGEIRIPYAGVWTADLDLDTADALAGAVTVKIGALTLRGTVDASHSGTFGEARRIRVLGGAGGWGRELAPRAYHDDAGVKRSAVLQQAATEAGEQLALGNVEARIGLDFERLAGPASRVFDHAATGLVWWVAADGVTHVDATRAPVEVAAGVDLELLDYDPRSRVAVLAGEPAAIAIGTVLRKRLDEPVMVRELVYRVTPSEARIYAHGAGGEGGRLAAALRAFVRDAIAETLPGLYRYRVVEMTGDRARLQAVSRGKHPNVLPGLLGTGIAGGWAALTPGALVLVGFEDGSPTAPVILSYTPRGRPGHVPAVAALDGDEVQLGDHEAAVHRVGDGGEAGTLLISNIPGGTPAGIVITYTPPEGAPVVGTISGPISIAPDPVTAALLTIATGGSPKVKA